MEDVDYGNKKQMAEIKCAVDSRTLVGAFAAP